MDKRKPSALPLYVQVNELLVRDIVEGRWKAGEVLPSEFDLADEFGVSQGTVRKALNALADEKIVLRRQGKGTYVTETTPQHSLFHFFHITRNDGLREAPQSQMLSVEEIDGIAKVNDDLGRKHDEPLVFIERIRLIDTMPALFERIYLPADLFVGLVAEKELPDALYNLYECAYGVTIHSADDRIKAQAADREVASRLKIPNNAPVLVVERRAYTLDGRAVEFRVSYCENSRYHYFVKLN